jgi:ectoine hydroxylase-related dioxygenase (phytanoyl-CoA dioxygenase family)
MNATFSTIDNDACEAYAELGAVCLRDVFTDWVELLRAGVEHNHDEPGPYFSENVVGEDDGRFWDDYCNWQLVKEPNTPKPTPWHQDAPYYFADGTQTVSFWLPLDVVSKAETLRLVAGSNRWPKPVLPVKWLDDADFYGEQNDQYMTLPDLDDDHCEESILEWEMQPGDAVLFDFRTVHGARGNLQDNRRRAFSIRWVGDDGHYTERPGRTSPPYPGHDMIDGQKLREDWFPVLWPRVTTN